jgi:broad specificity phosphatase PhoE
MIRLLLLLFVILCSCKTTTYYISRHAEKAGAMTADPPLTAEGEKQALELRNYIAGKRISAVYSTNFIRTKATATPTADANNLAVNIYNPAQGNALVDSLKAGNKKNVLIIGHSNTVDDLVNRFLGTQTVTDLPETEYGSLFIVQKRRSGYSYRKVSVLRTEGR